MRRFIYILLFLLSLPFREGAGSVFASYFEVQVPMSSGGTNTTSSAQVKHISCGGGSSVAAAGTNRSTQPFRPMQSVCNVPAVPVVRTTGRFTTTVNPLDDNGRAYAPGQVPAGNASGPQHLRRVSHDDDEDDQPLSVYDAALIWASNGKDEDYMFGYSEEELEEAFNS